jgi:type IV secretion system protein VirD4
MSNSLQTTLNKPGGKLLLLGLLVALALGWLFLSGMIFLMLVNKDPNNAELLTLYQYWYHYRTAPGVLDKINLAALIGLGIIFFPMLLLLMPAASKNKLFGDARFAGASEIKKAGLLGDKGIIVGSYAGKYLMFPGQQHAIISAPTRSGKGVGIVIPNLLNWPESIVVLDIKQENWDITSGFRKKHGQECFLFNPAATDYRTHRYNPLAYISSDPNFRIDDVQKIANMLFPDEDGTDVIWTATPRSLFLGIVLMLAETPEKPLTLGQVVRETLVDGDGAKYFAKLINERAAAGKSYSGTCVRALNSYVSISAENTRAGVITSFRSRLELWINPLVTC